MANTAEARGQKLQQGKFLRTVETVGNKMVQPVTMFGILCVIVVLLSWIGSVLGWSATGLMYDSKAGAVVETTVTLTNMLSREGIIYMMDNFISNVINYSPLGTMIVMFVGIGLADGSGFIAICLRKVVKVCPEKIVLPVLMILSVCGNLASASCTLVLCPIAAVIYYNYGKHPIAGMMGVLAAITAGYSANFIPADVDAILSGITTEAAAQIDPNYVVTPLANYYFMFAGTIILGLVCWFVTEKFIEPMLGEFDPADAGEELVDVNLEEITEKETKAFRAAILTLLALVAILVVLCIPENSIMRNAATGSLLTKSVLMNDLILILTILFFIPSLVYGFMSGKFKSEKDVVNQIYKSFGKMASVLAVALTAGQFMKWFSYSKLGNLVAFAGANLLQKLALPNVLVLLVFAIFTALVNILMNSASAKWYIFAPVFVPMLMQLGIAPEVTQLFYRVADSCTNAVTPLNSMLPVVIMMMQKYKKDAGIGTYVATCLPYSLAFFAVWIPIAVIWYAIGLPIGPGAALTYVMPV